MKIEELLASILAAVDELQKTTVDPTFSADLKEIDSLIWAVVDDNEERL